MQSLYLISVLVTVLSVAWLVLSLWMWRLHRSRTQPELKADTKILIVYASQTGNAQSIAQHFAKSLSISEKVSAISLNALTFEHLLSLEKVLFVISTYGDGDAPDNGSLFTKLLTSNSDNHADMTQLNHLGYSVIALGDSTYPDFCAFGYQVDQIMKGAGASQLSEVITVDNYDEGTTSLEDITPDWFAISHESLMQQPLSQERLTQKLIQTSDSQAVKPTQYWQLTQRELLNPECNDEKLLQITFKSIGPSPVWQAGDLIEIQPKQPIDIVEKWLEKNKFNGDVWLTHQGRQQTLKAWLLERKLPEVHSYSADELLQELPYLAKRSYSIASIPEEGHLQLIVRLFEKPNSVTKKQAFGLASGFLSHYCQVGDVIEGHIKTVNSHHNIDHSKPIILIGAGSGLAGLKAQISARFYLANQQKQTVGQSWLIFGERSSKAELPINKTLVALEKEPVKVNKLSCAFSQDNQHPKYVQNVLFNQQDKLHQWIDDGAYIYVCGSLVGMGKSVEDALVTILGQEMIEELQQQQRYIRDVY